MWTEFPSSQLEYRREQETYGTLRKAPVNSVPNQHSLCRGGQHILAFCINWGTPVRGPMHSP